ncbi:RnfH family protein [Lysobacter korlensis]|uniref:UPF0125 protein ACFFGH_15865 n=1 Tax=Lysobacter korlensis TaxID=553636 RepID=A0ABV6RQR7_9GAMM
MKVEVIRAWPRRFETTLLELPLGSTVRDALRSVPMAGGEVAVAIHGLRVTTDTPLSDGDRIELLRPLVADPKESRRRRARERQAPAR